MKHNPPILSSRRNEVKERILKVLLHFTKQVSCHATSRYAPPSCVGVDMTKGRGCTKGKGSTIWESL